MNLICKIDGSYVETEIDDEVVLMRLADGDFFSLEGTARAIWAAIDGTRSRAEIATLLADRFEAPAAAIRADVDAFIADLAAAGLVSG